MIEFKVSLTKSESKKLLKIAQLLIANKFLEKKG